MNNNELRDKAVEDGIRFAKQIFVTRGNKSEMHITQANLAAYLTIAFENGAKWATSQDTITKLTAALKDARRRLYQEFLSAGGIDEAQNNSNLRDLGKLIDRIDTILREVRS